MTRRTFIAELVVLLGAILIAGIEEAEAWRPWRRRRRRRRLIRRRRVRRRVLFRTFGGARLLVVPLAVNVGWELAYGGRVVVVKEVKEKTIIVEHSDGKTEEIEVHKEDTKENTEDVEGSEIVEEVDA